jgi:cytochrome c-type biogenesis protein CcmH/NrfG
MSTWIFLALLLITTVFVVIAPLWNRRADRPLGQGIETDDTAERWREEKDRLVAEQRALDMALASGEIDVAEHARDRAILQHEADRALDRLRKSRGGTTRRRPAVVRPGKRPALGAALAATIVLLTGAMTHYLSQQDLQRNVSPHADGRIPVAAATATGRQAPAERSGAAQPDVGAMVATLEARVNAGAEDVTTPDLLMLGRSYRVMGRKGDAIKTYRRVLSAEPRNLAATMGVGSILLNSSDKAERAEADQLIERALTIKPDFPEALWLKSLALVRDHDIENAMNVLNRLSPMVQNNPPAKTAVEELLSKLERPPSGTPVRAR